MQRNVTWLFCNMTTHLFLVFHSLLPTLKMIEILNSQMKGLEQGQAGEQWDNISLLVFTQENAREKPHRIHELPWFPVTFILNTHEVLRSWPNKIKWEKYIYNFHLLIGKYWIIWMSQSSLCKYSSTKKISQKPKTTVSQFTSKNIKYYLCLTNTTHLNY